MATAGIQAKALVSSRPAVFIRGNAIATESTLSPGTAKSPFASVGIPGKLCLVPAVAGAMFRCMRFANASSLALGAIFMDKF